MYNQHFGIAEKPFTMAPDPRFLYMSDGHREAFAHLLYGIKAEEGGFVLLTGEVGTGKTTVCRCLLEQLPEQTNVAVILNPKVTALELLASICDEFRISYPPANRSIKVFVDLINAFLLEAHGLGQKNVLIIDEAQNLDADVLEQIRLLTNLETNERKLLQIILLGQPELLEILARPEMRQLAQRVTARYHLRPLTQEEVALYVRHRLAVAGLQNLVFPDPCLAFLYQQSKGIPRLINVLCDRALLGAYVQGKSSVDHATLKRAAREVLWARKKSGRPSRRTSLLFGASITVLALIAVALLLQRNQPAVPGTATGAATVVQATASEPVPVTTAATTPKPLDATENPPPTAAAALDWPAETPRSASWDLAVRALFAQWRQTYNPAASDACRQAEKMGLRCLRQEGGLESLLSFNQPAVLRLVNKNNEAFYATITAVDGQTATLSMAGESKTVALADLALRWSGEFTLLWKMPPGYEDSIRPGRVGPEVQWLDQQLASIFKRSASSDNTLQYGDQLVQEIKQFQFSEGLIPDGVAGVKTLIRINTAAGNNEAPGLTARKSK